jgi:hypothetical protein
VSALGTKVTKYHTIELTAIYIYMACDQSWRLLPVGRPILLTTDLLTPYKRMHADTVAASVLDPRLHTHALVLLSIDPCMHENHSAPTALL